MQEQVAVIGASGAIGSALCEHAEARGALVARLSRPLVSDSDDSGLADAAAAASDDLSHVIVASGLLHRDGHGPEREWRQLDSDWMLASYRANAVIPALAAKHFLPRLARSRASRPLFAVLTARVGSIGDNRLGGWYSYRMAKAAANQLVRTLSVEMQRRNPRAVVVALHPGTVESALSKPFQRNLPAGQMMTASEAAARLWSVMDGLTASDSGSFVDWKGETIPW